MKSAHFSIDEFRCHDGTEYPPEWVEDRLAVLCRVLDAIRDSWGGPLTVVSGYRTSAFNQALADASAARNGGVSGVAKDSQHVQGRAADIRPANPTPERVTMLHERIKELFADGRIQDMGGLGVYPGWCHVDVREKTNGHLATWTGVGVGSEPTG